jgi:hypothetical protein
MAKGFKTGGKNFKRGVVTNPNGRPKLPPELKAARALGRELVELRVFELKRKTEAELRKIMGDPETSIEDKLIISVMFKGVHQGDFNCLGFITDFIFGKRADNMKMDLSSSDGSMTSKSQVIIMLPAEDA